MDISALRAEVDRIDAEMLKLLDKRVGLARSITDAKVEQGRALKDESREQQMLIDARKLTHERLTPDDAAEFRSALIEFTRTAVARRRGAPKPMEITIIGLGLIGGSIARALKASQNEHSLHGVDLADRLDAPRASGLFESVVADSSGANSVKHADVVFLCTPVGRTIELLPTLADDIPKEAVVTDVASVKHAVATAALEAFNFPDAPYFVGGHPMAGKAQFGFEHSDARLFEGRPWILTPTPHDPVAKLDVLHSLIASMGARLHLMKPAEHDHAMAVASHLPQMVSTALMLTAGDRANAVAGPALSEMTRLAASPGALWNELTRHVKKELIGELQSLKSYLTEIEMAVHFGEPLDKWFDRANSLRFQLEAAQVAKQPGKP
jgi:prephenate dehydrogenase/chorismate mutase